MKNKKIVITGATGYLGRVLTKVLLDTRKYNLVLLTEDLTEWKYDAGLSRTLIDADAVIHLAAIVPSKTANDERVMDVNSRATRKLAQLCPSDTHFVFLSSDYVFASDEYKEYTIHDERHPETIYGKSKVAAENSLRATQPKLTVLRTSMLYGYCTPERKNFIQYVKEELEAGNRVDIYQDVYSRPTHVLDLCNFIEHVIEQELVGTYHTCGHKYISRRTIAMHLGLHLNAIGSLNNSTCSLNYIDQPEGGRIPLHLNMKPSPEFLAQSKYSITLGDFFNAI